MSSCNRLKLVLYQGTSKREQLVMAALFIADNETPLNSQDEGRDRPNLKFKAHLRFISRELFYPCSGARVELVTMIFP